MQTVECGVGLLDSPVANHSICQHGMIEEWCSQCTEGDSGVLNRISGLEYVNRAEKSIDTLVDSFLSGLAAKQSEALLRTLVLAEFKRARRDRVRGVEETSTIRYSEEKVARKREQAAQYKESKREADMMFRETPWQAPDGTKVGARWQLLPVSERKQIVEQKEPGFAEFLARNASPWDRDEDYASRIAYCSWKCQQSMEELQKRAKKIAMLELTDELLSSTFALGNGDVVEWGEATADHHLARVKMLMAQAGGHVDTAKRHEAAILLLEKHRVGSLNQIKEK